ncbi:MAG: hypothetical protein MHMPM18_002234 [Marteilia pararefringens]
MLEFSLDDPTVLQRVADSISQVCQEANLECSASGLSLSGMDAGHISLAKLILKSDFFRSYRCDRSCTLGIHFTTLHKVLKCADRDEQVTFLHQEGSDELTMKKKKVEEDLNPGSYTLKLICLESERLDINSSEDGAKIVVSASQFQKIVKDLSIFGEDMVLECPYKANKKERYLRISSKGDIGSGEQILRDTSFSSAVDVKKDPNFAEDADDDKAAAINGTADENPKKKRAKSEQNVNGHALSFSGTAITYGENFSKLDQKCSDGQGVRLTFATQYLNTFCKAAALGDKLTINLAKNNPIEMEFAINDFGKLSFYLAPRYTDDAL